MAIHKKMALVSRDGVINEAREGGINHRTQLTFINGSIDALAKLYQSGYTVVIVTHQPGISRGLLDLDEMEAIHAYITAAAEKAGGQIEGIFYCPHDTADNCYCRPPQTGLLDVIAIEFDADLASSVYFFHNHDEKILSDQKQCQGFLCDDQHHLIEQVNALLSSGH